jgi:hypothetical protein
MQEMKQEKKAKHLPIVVNTQVLDRKVPFAQ